MFTEYQDNSICFILTINIESALSSQQPLRQLFNTLLSYVLMETALDLGF